MGSHTQPKLPVIDFSEENLKPGTNSWISTRNETVRALEEYGCFIAVYDRVSLELHNAIFRASKELFDLPTETKILNTCDPPTHGYMGQRPAMPLYESLGIENSTTLQGAQNFTNLMWPSGNDFFCETALSFSKKVSKLDQMVMKMVSESYGIEKFCESLLGSTCYLSKFIKYKEPKMNETNLGIGPHTDRSFISILHQHQVEGLEIKTRDDQWILIEPSPSSFMVMAGEAFMAWTNGRIESPSHRVIMSSKERYSLGLFSFVRDLIIQTPEELVDETHPLQYKPFQHYKYLHFCEHPDVGRRIKCPIKAYCAV